MEIGSIVGRYAVGAAVRAVVFNAVVLAGLAWYRSPEAFATAVGSGFDPGALVGLVLSMPDVLPVAGMVTVLAVVWPFLGRGSRHGGDGDGFDFGGFGGDGE